jgi:hypothetical protein
MKAATAGTLVVCVLVLVLALVGGSSATHQHFDFPRGHVSMHETGERHPNDSGFGGGIGRVVPLSAPLGGRPAASSVSENAFFSASVRGESGRGSRSAGDAGQGGGVRRKQVYSAALTVVVNNVSAWAADVERVALGAGGYLERAERVHESFNGKMRVPSEQLKSVLEQLTHVASVASVSSESLTRSDVTDSYSDAEARVAVLQASRTQLLQLMTKAHNVADTILVEDRLTQVNGQLDVLLGQLKRMDGDVAFSTVTLYATLRWKPQLEEFSVLGVVYRAGELLATVAQRLLVAGIYAVVFSPFALLFVVAVHFIVRLVLSRLSRN